MEAVITFSGRHFFALCIESDGAWLRVKGYGLSVRDMRNYEPLFSERMGEDVMLDVGSWRVRLLRPTSMSGMIDDLSTEPYVIEFRSGSYFQNLERDTGGPRASAEQFASKAVAERFMSEHDWIVFNGGMAVPACDHGATIDTLPSFCAGCGASEDTVRRWRRKS